MVYQPYPVQRQEKTHPDWGIELVELAELVQEKWEGSPAIAIAPGDEVNDQRNPQQAVAAEGTAASLRREKVRAAKAASSCPQAPGWAWSDTTK
ncbi:MAG: hypothetical protein D6722_02960 [Bacteroidetes bacterium]|nr:MAG: hypothetical protein D6722_02960 [Bacteroidota bacterium]